MRIAVWAEICLSNDTGMGRVARNILAELSLLDRCNEYTLFHSANFPDGSLSGMEFGGRFRVRRVALSRRILRAGWLVSALPVERLIGAHDVVFNPAAYAITTRSAVFRAMIHDLAVQHVPEAYSFKDRNIGRLSEDRVVRCSDRILAVSESTRRDILRRYEIDPGRVHVAPLGTTPGIASVSSARVEAFRGKHGISTPYVFWVGQIQYRKNVATLIEAVALARMRIPNLTLALAGTFGYRGREAIEAAKRHRVESAVHFLGRVSDEDVAAGMTGAVAFAYPSLYEGFGIPVLEAFACGVPVIASSSSSLPEIVGDAGVLVSPRDPRAMADALVRVSTETPLRHALQTAGKERVKEFTWRRTAEAVLAFLEAPRFERQQ